MIEPALAEELRRSPPDAAIPVIIEHVRTVEAPSGTDPGGALAALDRTIELLQRGIVARLAELGVRDPRRAALANALFAALTPAQIEAIAAHPDVRMVRGNRPEVVTI